MPTHSSNGFLILQEEEDNDDDDHHHEEEEEEHEDDNELFPQCKWKSIWRNLSSPWQKFSLT